MNYFTHYWRNDTWEYNRRDYPEGELLDHIAGNIFLQRGVEIGDTIYIVTVNKGKLYLCCKILVDKICGVNEAAADIGKNPEDLWQADEHIAASASTPIHWDFEVPIKITKQLKFLSGDESKHLTFLPNDKLDQQTLRGVRRLTTESAATLDKLLGDLKPIKFLNQSEFNERNEILLWKETAGENEEVNDFESYIEGSKKQKFVTYYERIPENRNQAIKIHGCTCFGCGFNFEKIYGSHGKGFIHIHHIKPVSQFEKPQKVNPETDLIPLCPNCHAMIHRNRNKTLSLEELKTLISVQ